MYILIVDNDRSFVSVIQTMLFKEGFNRIGIADNGFECVFQVKACENPDVIIIDERQCYINGIDVLEKIRFSLPETRIIILIGEDADLNIDILPDNRSIFLMSKSYVTADNLPQVLYTIVTQKISSTKIPSVNKVYSSLRRAFTGMLN